MIRKDLRSLREEYASYALNESEAADHPFVQFASWFDQALDAGIAEPNAMTLATVDESGRPAARVVLLKELDPEGFVFFTNYLSNKGRQLATNPYASMVFLWLELQRQVRISGRVAQLSPAASDAYFATRPRESQLGALASPQSQVISSREYLEKRYAAIDKEYTGKEIVRPTHWGGYRLIPDAVEFWQGRPGRLHDRLLYMKQPIRQQHSHDQKPTESTGPDSPYPDPALSVEQTWKIVRLAP